MKARDIYYLITAALLIGGGIAGCSGGSTSGGEESFGGQVFSSAGGTTGKLDLRLNTNVIRVGDTEEFIAYALDSKGKPIPSLQLVCDSEAGVAILDPVMDGRAFALTNSRGAVSGVIGCRSPGSFQFGCRMASGGDRRQFMSIKCDGTAPDGFRGFPNSAGGTLGGGPISPADGGPGGGGEQLLITRLAHRGAGDGNSTSVDIERNQCVTCSDRSRSQEPFTDDLVEITIRNNLSSRIVLDGIKYSIDTESEGRIESENIAVVGNAKGADPDTDVTFSSLLFRASDGVKYFADSLGTQIREDSFGNLSVTVYAHDAFGKTVTSTAALALSFGSFNFCPAATLAVPQSITGQQIAQLCPAAPTAAPTP